jgi:hypothetical protein
MEQKSQSNQPSEALSPPRLIDLNFNTVRIGDFVLYLEPEPISWWRYMVFTTIVANIAFSIPFLIDGVNVRYFDQSLFRFHNYSLIIWLVPITFFFFGMIQLIPRTYTNPGYDQLFRPLFFTTVLQLSCLNILEQQTGPGVILMFGTLISSILLFIYARKVLTTSSVKTWLQIPFSLYMASLSIITITAVAGWLHSMGFTGGAAGEVPFTILMIVFTTLLGTYMTFRKQDFIFPLVMAWSDISLWTEHFQTSPPISMIALSLGIFMIWCAIVTLISTKLSDKIELTIEAV